MMRPVSKSLSQARISRSPTENRPERLHCLPFLAHPHALRHARPGPAPMYLALQSTDNRTCENRAQHLLYLARCVTEFPKTLYATSLHSSHCSPPHPHTPTGRTCPPCVSETPGNNLQHLCSRQTSPAAPRSPPSVRSHSHLRRN